MTDGMAEDRGPGAETRERIAELLKRNGELLEERDRLRDDLALRTGQLRYWRSKLGAAGGKDAEVERLRAVLPKAWNVLGLVDKLKQGDTFVAKELRDELIALARPAGEGEG